MYPPQKRALLTDGSRVCELPTGDVERKNDTIDFYKSMAPVMGAASTWLKSQQPLTDESNGKESTEGDDVSSPRAIAGESSPHSFDHLTKMVSDAMPKELVEAQGDDLHKMLTDAMPVLKGKAGKKNTPLHYTSHHIIIISIQWMFPPEKATELLDKVDKEKNPLAGMAAEFLRSMDKDKDTDQKGERRTDNSSSGSGGLDWSNMAAKAQEMAANNGGKQRMDKVESMFTDLRTKVDQVNTLFHSFFVLLKFILFFHSFFEYSPYHYHLIPFYIFQNRYDKILPCLK